MNPSHATRWLTAALVCLMALAAFAQSAAKARARGVTGTAPPPTFDSETIGKFFADARDHLGPGQPSGLTPAATNVAPPSVVAGEQVSSAASGAAWSRLVSAETLENEVKAQLPLLAAALKTPTAFTGGGFEKARKSFSVLAILFAVIAEYDGDVRWKRDAAALKTAFGRASQNTKTSSDAAFNESKLRMGDLESILRGESAAVENAEAPPTWGELVGRPPLMSRMEEAQRGRLDAWTSNAGEFGKNRDDLMHEAELLAMLAEVIHREGFEYADDPAFVEYAEKLREQCLLVIEAAKKGDSAAASSAVRQINQTCDACHGDYRG